MRMRMGAARSMLRLSIWRRVEVYTVPVRTTAGGSYSELVEQPPRIDRVPVRIAAFKNRDSKGQPICSEDFEHTNGTFKAFIIPQNAQSLMQSPSLEQARV